MPYGVGALLALVVSVFARVVGLDRDRAFYPTVLVVVATYYILFAVVGGSTRALVLECLGAIAFVALAVAGFRRSAWFTVAGLVGHGVFDGFHGLVIDNPGLPTYWPAFCMTYDVAAGAIFAWLVSTARAANEMVA